MTEDCWIAPYLDEMCEVAGDAGGCGSGAAPVPCQLHGPTQLGGHTQLQSFSVSPQSSNSPFDFIFSIDSTNIFILVFYLCGVF